ncbi:MAG: VWA domain-containing protein [Bacteroidota bacterium]
MGFYHIHNWIWLLAIPVVAGILYFLYLRVNGIVQNWFSEDEYERNFAILKQSFRLGAFSLMVLALMGPYFGENSSETDLLRRNIYILLDVSASMNAEDLQPSRLEKARKELKSMIRKLEGENIGLILFAENAYVQCPLTQDHEALMLFLDLAESHQFSQTGTSFRNVLLKAEARFDELAQAPEFRSNAVVLVSDGEDHGDRYVSLIERLKRQQVKIFPVGVGTTAGAAIPLLQNGRKQGFIRHPDGSLAISQLIEEPMQDLASEFDTSYRRLNDQDDALDRLAEDIEQMAASPYASAFREMAGNRYQILLFLAFLLYVATFFMMPIRNE